VIYVLSNNRIETMKWARSQGLPMLKIRHVQNARVLPGVLNPKKTRIVVLPGYAKRFDKFAIKARLKLITRKAKIELEQWTQLEDGTYVPPEPAAEPPEVSTETLVQMAEGLEVEVDVDELFDEGGQLSAGETEVTNDTGNPEKVVLVKNGDDFLKVVGAHLAKQPGNDADKAAFMGNLGAGLPPGDSEVPATYAEGDDSKASVAKTTLPTESAEKATEPVDFLVKREEEISEVQDVVEQTRDDLTDVADGLAELVEAKESGDVGTDELNEPAPKKARRPRRTNAQIAYDDALVAWESHKGSVEAVQEARKALKAGDERLEFDPTTPDDLDF
jgi:hypothetical protein